MLTVDTENLAWGTGSIGIPAVRLEATAIRQVTHNPQYSSSESLEIEGKTSEDSTEKVETNVFAVKVKTTSPKRKS